MPFNVLWKVYATRCVEVLCEFHVLLPKLRRRTEGVAQVQVTEPHLAHFEDASLQSIIDDSEIDRVVDLDDIHNFDLWKVMTSAYSRL